MEALVLSREPRFEFDELVLLLSSRDELIRAVARGSKKSTSKNSFHLEPATHAEIEIVEGKEWRYIGSVVPLSDGSFPRTTVEALVSLSYALTLIATLLKERARYEGLYATIISWRNVLANETERGRNMVSPFLVVLLRALGYRPIVDHCSRCAKEVELDAYWFSVSDGGMVCVLCKQEAEKARIPLISLSKKEYVSLRTVCLGGVSASSLEVLKKDYRILHQFLQFHLEDKVPECLLFS
jgi:DNA repair protein RecO (recombination protein O)